MIVEAGIALDVELVSAGRLRRKRPRLTATFGAPEPDVLPSLGPWEAMHWSYIYGRHKDPPPPPGSIGYIQDSDGRYVWQTYPRAKPSRGARRVVRWRERLREQQAKPEVT